MVVVSLVDGHLGKRRFRQVELGGKLGNAGSAHPELLGRQAHGSAGLSAGHHPAGAKAGAKGRAEHGAQCALGAAEKSADGSLLGDLAYFAVSGAFGLRLALALFALKFLDLPLQLFVLRPHHVNGGSLFLEVGNSLSVVIFAA